MDHDIESLVEEFLKINRKKSDKDVRKIFCAPDGKGLISAVLIIDENWDFDVISAAMREVVKKSNRSKELAFFWLKKFAQWLENNNLIDESIIFPPVKSTSVFERRIFVAKYLQDPNHKISDLEDLLWVSSRTIEEDIRVLRGEVEEESIQICGKEFTIPKTDRSLHKLYMESTVHPVLLTSNLTQIIVILKGLKKMEEDPAFYAYSRTQAVNIWQQLSDYAKRRILYVTKNLIPDDYTWYENLDEKDERAFRTEANCSNYGCHVILECLKNDKPCVLEYKDQDMSESKFYKVKRVFCYRKNPERSTVEVILEDGSQKTLDIDNIAASAYTEDELI